jgi:hypothetical protein
MGSLSEQKKAQRLGDARRCGKIWTARGVSGCLGVTRGFSMKRASDTSPWSPGLAEPATEDIANLQAGAFRPGVQSPEQEQHHQRDHRHD